MISGAYVWPVSIGSTANVLETRGNAGKAGSPADKADAGEICTN